MLWQFAVQPDRLSGLVSHYDADGNCGRPKIALDLEGKVVAIGWQSKRDAINLVKRHSGFHQHGHVAQCRNEWGQPPEPAVPGGDEVMRLGSAWAC